MLGRRNGAVLHRINASHRGSRNAAWEYYWREKRKNGLNFWCTCVTLIYVEKMPDVFSFPEDGKKTPKYNGACTYLIVSPDGTPYVGQAKKFRNRMWAHKSTGKRAWINHAKHQAGKHAKVAVISFAINKHGWENMQITILQKYSVWDQQLLDSREQYFIRFYDSFKNGYNCNEGGNRCKAHPHTEETKQKLSAALMGHTNSLTKPVTSCKIKKSYSDGTQLVKFVLYASAREAEKETGINFQNISKCCLKKLNSVGGRYWFFTHENHPPEIIKVGTIRVPYIGDVPKICLVRALFSESRSGEKQLHESQGAARRTLSASTGKKFHSGHICRCCSSKHKATHHHGYRFWFASDKEIAEFEKEASKKRKRK